MRLEQVCFGGFALVGVLTGHVNLFIKKKLSLPGIGFK